MHEKRSGRSGPYVLLEVPATSHWDETGGVLNGIVRCYHV